MCSFIVMLIYILFFLFLWQCGTVLFHSFEFCLWENCRPAKNSAETGEFKQDVLIVPIIITNANCLVYRRGVTSSSWSNRLRHWVNIFSYQHTRKKQKNESIVCLTVITPYILYNETLKRIISTLFVYICSQSVFLFISWWKLMW